MQTWFECKVKYVKIDDDGRERKVSEVYLVDAVTFTDAETRIIQQLQTMVRGEFVVDNIKKSNIVEIFPYEEGEWWYKAKIAIVTIDENAGKEKKINNYFLVAADVEDEAAHIELFRRISSKGIGARKIGDIEGVTRLTESCFF